MVPKIPELLAPAGSYEKLVTAVHYGADAVYLGGMKYGLRARAGNFDNEGLCKAVRYAHEHGVAVYVTVNIIAHNEDLDGLGEYLSFLRGAGVDALIVSDPGILAVAAETVPDLPLHLSTQANVTNSRAARFWLHQGVRRLNLARELSLEEIRSIKYEAGGEIEIFVHGALCISYSGRCMLSHYMTGRDANQGHCAHPCRYQYALLEEKRPGEFFPVEEDERGTYIFNAKDLCLLERLPELLAAGADSLKIEGRMKSIFYVGGVVRLYRACLDYLKTLGPEAWEYPGRIEIPRHLLDEIAKTGTRDMTQNFFDKKPGAAEMLYRTSRFEQAYEPVAVIRATGAGTLVEARNVLEPGDTIEYMDRGAEIQEMQVQRMSDERGNTVVRANPGDRVYLGFSGATGKLEQNGMFRRRKGSRDSGTCAPE